MAWLNFDGVTLDRDAKFIWGMKSFAIFHHFIASSSKQSKLHIVTVIRNDLSHCVISNDLKLRTEVISATVNMPKASVSDNTEYIFYRTNYISEK